jgi:hypothetical protein
VTEAARLRRILETSPTVAVLGLHDDPLKPAHYVPAYLHEHGYRVLGVNPALAGRVMFGYPVVASLGELTEPVDLVDVFRRPAALPAHLPELLALRPRAVWLQLGILHDEVAAALRAAGIELVQNRCTLRDHQVMGLGAPARPPAAG